MAFCTNCGTQSDAAFCTKCGQPVGAPSPSSSLPPSAPAPTSAAIPGAAKRKTSPLVWVLAAVAGVFVLIGMLMVGAGLFVANRVKNAGIDSALLKKNPALAAAKVMASLNPDVDVVNVDEDRGLLTIKDKKTGKIITINADDVKNGKLTFSDESSGEKVSFGANGAVQLPAWVPSYPDSKPVGTFSAAGSGSEGGMAHFTTNDTGAKVLSYYEHALKNAGFKITSTFLGDSSNSNGGVVTAEDNGNQRTIVVTVSSSENEGTNVALTYGSKK